MDFDNAGSHAEDTSIELLHEIIRNKSEKLSEIDFFQIQAAIVRIEEEKNRLLLENQELKRNEERMLEERNRFADIFYDGPFGYFVLDKQSHIKDINPFGCTLLGVTNSHELKNQPLDRYLCEFSVRSFSLHVSEVLRRFEGKSCEVRLRTAQGQEKELDLHISPWMDARYQVFCRVIATDITERKRKELTVQKTRELLDRVFSGDHQMAERHYPELRVLMEYDQGMESLDQARAKLQYEHFVEQRFASLTAQLLKADLDTTAMAFEIRDLAMALTGSRHGYVSEIDPATMQNIPHTLAEMMSQTCRVDKALEDAFPKKADGYSGLCGHVLNTLAPFYTNRPKEHLAWKNSAPEGHIPIRRFLSVPATASGVPYGQIALANAAADYTDDDLRRIGRLANIFALAVERRQKEDKLAQSEKQLRAIYQNLPLPTFIWKVEDEDFRLLFRNQAAVRSALSHAVVNNSLASSAFAEHPQILQIMAEACDQYELIQKEVLIAPERESPIHLDLRTALVESDLLILHAEDITARKQMEENLRLANQTCERANRIKNEFLASMSHEVRTPLNGVLGMLQLLESEPLSKEQEKLLEIAISSGRSLLSIISDILDFSKIEAGKISLSQENCDLPGLLQGVKRVLDVQAHEKGLTLELTIDANLPARVISDSGRLRQILFNLLGNAIKFTASGTIEFGAELLEKEETTAQIRFFVQDQGIGIPAEKLEVIFDPFVQVEGDHQRRLQGSGLGLSIVRRIVTLMEGSISAQSRPGEGSRFVVSLPFGICHHKEVAEKESSSLRPRTTKNLSVLVAEDNAVSRTMVKRMLERLGQSVRTAENGREALDLLFSEDFDLVLMDVQMPVLDGLESTRIIRSQEMPGIDPSIRVVALTAHTMKGDREAFLEAGMDDYLSKPIFFEDLEAVLERTAAGVTTRQ